MYRTDESLIDTTLKFDFVELEKGVVITKIASWFDVILFSMGRVSRYTNHENNSTMYDSAYYEMVNGELDLKEEFKKIIKEEL